VHTHAFEDPSKSHYNRPCTVDALLREMEVNQVDSSVLIPLPGWASNEYVATHCERNPRRLFAMYTPEIGRADTIAEMDAFFRRHAPRAIKIHPRVQNVTVRDAIVQEIVAWGAERAIPIVFDVFPFGPMIDDPAIAPLAYNSLAQRHPRATIVLAHA